MYEKQKLIVSKTIYIPLESLPPYNPNQNYLKLMREISAGIIECNEDDDRIHFINELRRMRKYHSDLFEAIYSNILPYYIANLMLSTNVNVCNNSLILVSEIFSYYDHLSQVHKLIPDLLPIVIELSASKFETIKKQSYIALNYLANNMFYQETLNTLLELIIEKDELQSENACETLIMFIHFMDEVNLLNALDWSDPCAYLCEMLHSRLPELIEKGLNVLYQLRIKFSADLQIFMSFFSDEQKRLIEDHLAEFNYKLKTTKIEKTLAESI